MPSGQQWRLETGHDSQEPLPSSMEESKSPAEFASSAFSPSKDTPTVDKLQPSRIFGEALDMLLKTLQPYLPIHRVPGKHVYKGAELIEHG